MNPARNNDSRYDRSEGEDNYSEDHRMTPEEVKERFLTSNKKECAEDFETLMSENPETFEALMDLARQEVPYEMIVAARTNKFIKYAIQLHQIAHLEINSAINRDWISSDVNDWE